MRRTRSPAFKRLAVCLLTGATCLHLPASAGAARDDWHLTGAAGRRALADRARDELAREPHRPELLRILWINSTPRERERLLGELSAGGGHRYEDVALRAELLVRKGQPALAADAFARARELRPGSIEAALGEARAARAADQLDRALRVYAEAGSLAGRGDTRRKILRELIAAGEAGQRPEAVREARHALAVLSPGDPDNTLALAASERATGHAARALDLLRTCAERACAHPDTRLERTLAALEGVARESDELPALQSWLEDHARKSAPIWESLARVREDLGDFPGAADAAERALALTPEDRERGRRMAALADRIGDGERATAIWERLAARAPWDANWAIELLSRRHRRGETEEAARRFDEALARFGRDEDALARLADLATVWGDTDRAFAAWDTVLARNPRSERALLALAEIHFQRGRRALAGRTWATLARQTPGVEARARLAETLADHGLLEEAAQQAEAARKLAPGSIEVWRALGLVRERQRNLGGAIEAWTEVGKRAQGPGQALIRREARARLLALWPEEGRARLEREAENQRSLLRRLQGDTETTLFLVEIERRLGRPDRALAALLEAADHDPGNGEVVWPAVRLCKQSRQLGEALARLHALAAHSPQHASAALAEAAEIEFGRRDRARAESLVEDVRRAPVPNGEALLKAAGVADRAGRPDLAAAIYVDLMKTGMGVRPARALARLRLLRGDSAAADQGLLEAARSSTDPETRADLLRALLPRAELAGSLMALVPVLAAGTRTGGEDERALLFDFLVRALPTLAREASAAPGAEGERERLARLSLRPLLATVVSSDSAAPDLRAIELLGLLGRSEAVAPLAALIADPRRRAWLDELHMPAQQRRLLEIQIALALGRLADERGAVALRRLASTSDANLRAAALWALGRSGEREDVDLLLAALRDPRPEAAAAAALALGRSDDARAAEALAAAASDPRRVSLVRRAALLALTLRRRALPPLPWPTLLNAADAGLAAAAVTVQNAFERGLVLVDRPRGRGRLDLEAMLGRLAHAPDPASSVDTLGTQNSSSRASAGGLDFCGGRPVEADASTKEKVSHGTQVPHVEAARSRRFVAHARVRG